MIKSVFLKNFQSSNGSRCPHIFRLRNVAQSHEISGFVSMFIIHYQALLLILKQSSFCNWQYENPM